MEAGRHPGLAGYKLTPGMANLPVSLASFNSSVLTICFSSSLHKSLRNVHFVSGLRWARQDREKTKDLKKNRVIQNFSLLRVHSHTGESQVINAGGRTELGNHHFVAITVIIDMGKNYPWMLAPFGDRFLGNRIVTESYLTHNLLVTLQREKSFTAEIICTLAKESKLTPPIKGSLY